jgi:CheY-like chemotaxis protein
MKVDAERALAEIAADLFELDALFDAWDGSDPPPAQLSARIFLVESRLAELERHAASVAASRAAGHRRVARSDRGPGELRVLVVDDEPGMREAISDLFTEQGHVVVAEARNGQEAMEAAASFRPEVVLLDLRLGQESGLDVARALTTEWPDLPVLLISVGEESAKRVAASGARGLIVKHRLHTVDLDALCRS